MLTKKIAFIVKYEIHSPNFSTTIIFVGCSLQCDRDWVLCIPEDINNASGVVMVSIYYKRK